MKHRLIAVFSFAALVLVIWAGELNGSSLKYVEDFTTNQYKDNLNTTAWWDTVSGALTLFPFTPTLAGSYNTPGYAFHVAISGDYAFVADDVSGLQVLDISDPTAPALAGTYNTSGNARRVVVDGDYAYVADWNSGLLVFDISNPAVPAFVASYNTPGSARCVDIAGDYAYVADTDSGIVVLDISDPTTPSLAGKYDTQGTAYSVAIDGDYAYVGDGYSNALLVFDISDPANPDSVGSCATADIAKGVTISGDYLYVAVSSSGLQVLDISDPTAPSLAGSYDTPGNAFDVAVSGDRAYVADYAAGVQVLDISDPTTPTYVGIYDTPGGAYSVTISGRYAYVADDNSGVQVIEIREPVPPVQVGLLEVGLHVSIHVSGDHAYVAANTMGLEVIDISDPTAPAWVEWCDTPGLAQDLDVTGDYAYVADAGSGLQVIDISDPTAPSLVGSYDTPGVAYGVTVAGDHAYVADWDSGLEVLDISDPTAPSLAGSYDAPGYACDVAVSGDYAYVASAGSGLQVIDISDPTAPAPAGNYDTPSPGDTRGVAISGDYAYLADGYAGLQVIDISDPTAPSLAGSCATPYFAWDVAISGDYAYLACEDSGLVVVDISNPTSPTFAWRYDSPGKPTHVSISGEFVWLPDKPSFRVIQVFQSEVDGNNNVGSSLVVDTANDTIFGGRLSTTQTNTVTWELSADGGVNWQGVAPDESWIQMAVPGTDLMWRSAQSWTAPGGPNVTQMEIDWLVEPAIVDSIMDVPDDQGGWVRVYFTRSGRDYSGEVSLPITEYGIWEQVTDPVLVAAVNSVSTSAPEKRVADEKQRLAGMPVITHQGRTYVQFGPDLAATSFPVGTWEWVATVPAVQQDAYIARVPTVADSSGSGMNYGVFVITAHTTTPSIWYVSEPDSGYSLDNIAPAVPTGFAVAYNTGSGNQLSWDPCPDEDFQYFCVYRSDDPDFEPAPDDLVHTTTASGWNDPEYDGWNVYYRITACDFVGNESDAASAEMVTAATEPVLPRSFALYQNVPNPFNPVTAIRYDVPPGGGKVTLRLYDVSGRLVRTLVEGVVPAGEREVTWDGRDTHGRRVASGVYFYRLTSETFSGTRKMLLMK